MKNLIMILLCPIILTIGCNDAGNCLNGSGQLADYELSVSAFENVSLSGPINLRITQGDADLLTIECEPEVIGVLEYTVQNNILFVGFEKNVRCLDNIKDVWVNVTMKDLKGIYVEGISTVINQGTLELKDLRIDVEGVGDITLSGSVVNQTISVDGTANVDNESLSSSNTNIEVRGSAFITVDAQEKLDIDVEGSSTVKYVGTPIIHQDVDGSLQLIGLD